MKTTKIIGIVVFIIGLAMIATAFYIKKEVLGGQAQIASAQSKVDLGNTLFSQSEYTKPVGKIFTDSSQNQINAGQNEINYYIELAQWLQIGGIVIAIIGVILLFL